MAGKQKKKKDIKIQIGVLHVHTSQNNTIVTLTDLYGNKVYGWGSGLVWFKWTKQNTPYAAEMVAKQVIQEGKKYGLEKVGIRFKGIGLGREGVFKAINESWSIEIDYICEATPIQHGGCKGTRPKRN